MGALAIIDDRKAQRDTTRSIVEELVDGKFDVLDSSPLDDATDYPSWVLEENIVGLILDERLGEQRGTSGHVKYSGHDVVDVLADASIGLPIFVLTAYPDDNDVAARIDTVNIVMDRIKFSRKPVPFVKRMVAAAEQFQGRRESKFAELGRLAQRIASGSATRGETKDALGLQTELGISLPIDEIKNRSEWLSEAEEQLRRLKVLRGKAEARLKGRKK